MTDSIIIGAGAAGLMAARELVLAGKSVRVLEASNRIGGRIFTQHDALSGMPIELGAEFVHGEAKETTRLLDEARLATISVAGVHHESENGRIEPLGGAWNRMSLVFDHLNPRRKHDRPVQEFLDERPGGARLSEERKLARGFVEGFEAADMRLISEKSLAEQGDPTEGASEARRIVRGYGALLEFMLRDIEGRIRLRTAAHRIETTDTGVRIVDRRGGQHRARTVILAVPLTVLQDVSLAIEPDASNMRRAASQLVMGHAMRVNVVLKERFWEQKVADLSYLHTPKGQFAVWWTQRPVVSPMLTAWAGGPPAMALSHSADIESVVLAEMARAFKLRRARVDAVVESVHTHDWTRDVHVRGAYSYVGVGGITAPKRLARPLSANVFMAGEAGEPDDGGTVEAAIRSGRRAAGQVLRRLSS